VPNVPAHRYGLLRRFDGLVDCGVSFAEAVRPEHFPRGEFGVAEQQTPELDMIAVDGTLARARGANEFFKLEKALSRALEIDAALFCLGPTEFTEAGDFAWIDRGRVMRRSKAIAKRTLAFGAPHKAINVIGTGIVFDQTSQEIPVFRIIDTQRFGMSPVKVTLLQLLNVGKVGAENVFQPADHFHAAVSGGGQNFGEDIQIAVIGRASFLEDSILVELRVRRGEITTVEFEVVFLLSMIRKRLARNLPPSDAATVGENSEEQRIHTSALLQIVQDLFGTFVDERNGSHLNADHCFGLAGK